MNYDHHVRVYREILEPQRKHRERWEHLPGKPIAVNITIPTELIDIARTYPGLDWNDVMRTAVAGPRRTGAGE